MLLAELSLLGELIVVLSAFVFIAIVGAFIFTRKPISVKLTIEESIPEKMSNDVVVSHEAMCLFDSHLNELNELRWKRLWEEGAVLARNRLGLSDHEKVSIDVEDVLKLIEEDYE